MSNSSFYVVISTLSLILTCKTCEFFYYGAQVLKKYKLQKSFNILNEQPLVERKSNKDLSVTLTAEIDGVSRKLTMRNPDKVLSEKEKEQIVDAIMNSKELKDAFIDNVNEYNISFVINGEVIEIGMTTITEVEPTIAPQLTNGM